jgi:hypothetical protein
MKILDVSLPLQVRNEWWLKLFATRLIPINVTEQPMILNILETCPQVRITNEDFIQQIFLGRVQEWAIGRLATQDLIIHRLWISITEGGDPIYFINKCLAYPVTKSQMRTPRDQISAWKPCPMPFITSGAM